MDHVPLDAMTREMQAQPDVVAHLLQAYAPEAHGPLRLGERLSAVLHNRPNIVWAACGSSYWAATLGAYALAQLADAPCRVLAAHELIALGRSAFRQADLVILVSQSGETHDTLEAMTLARQHACPTLAIVNVPDSTMAQDSRFYLDTHAGREDAVPSTKGFMAQAVCALLVAAAYAQSDNAQAARDEVGALVGALKRLPQALRALDAPSDALTALVATVIQASQVIFVGRGPDYPIAAEGALKLMESAQVVAQGFAMGEFKHGPMACLNADTPIVAVVSAGPQLPRTRQNLNQMRQCGAPVWWIGPTGLDEMADFDGHHIVVDHMPPLVAPLVAVRVLQSLAWHAAIAKRLDPNAPKHLVKSVQQV